MTKDEALKLALEALEQLDGIDTETECVTIDVGDVMNTIKEALAQPVQEPVGQIGEDKHGLVGHIYDDRKVKVGDKIYTAQPQPEDRNFCPRCGKRTADLTTIHTCTPPRENT
jgi:hypothetical protein